MMRGHHVAVVVSILLGTSVAEARHSRPRPNHSRASAAASTPASAGPGRWLTLKNTAPLPNGVGTPLLLTDGTVLVFDQGGDVGTNQVWKLTPDISGSYVNGTWSQLASYPDYLGQPFSPYSAASAVLPDGRLIIAGGENNPVDGYSYIESGMVTIYDPEDDTWKVIPSPSQCTENPNIAGLFNIPGYEDIPFSQLPHGAPYIGDSASVILANGTFMLGCQGNGASATLDLSRMTWTTTGLGKHGTNHEEGWTLLPDGELLAVDLYVGITQPDPDDQVGTELFSPATGRWSQAANTVRPLSNAVYTSGQGGSGNYPYPDHEVGSTCLRPDGTVIALGGGSSGANGIYDTKTKRWSAGPRFPKDPTGVRLTAGDAPAALLPNGNVLVTAGSWDESALFGNPMIYFFEWTANRDELVPEPTTTNGSQLVPDYAYLLTLPTGHVLYAEGSSDVEVYVPGDTGHDARLEPVVTGSPDRVRAGKTYQIDGRLFNGWSQGAVYGDDYQNATNWPLVRITNKATHHVFYCRTHDHSFMGVAAENKPVHTFFDVPKKWAGHAMESGPSTIEVVANGIASRPVAITVD